MIMKKMHAKLVLFINLVGLFSFMDSSMQNNISEETFLVYRRYYFIERLDKTIQLLAKMYHEVNAMQQMLAQKKIDIGKVLPQSTQALFEHKQIKRSIDRIIQTRSLKPLFMVWDSFKSYKSLSDDLLVEDFSKEIFIITRNTVDYLYANEPTHKQKILLPSINKPYVLSERIDAIDTMTDYILDYMKKISLVKADHQGKTQDVDDIHLSIHTDEVAFRFYCLHRLEKAMACALNLPTREQDDLKKLDLFRSLRFKDRKSLAQIWQDVKQYKYIENEEYIKDFVIYVYLILQNEQSHRLRNHQLSHSNVLAIHQQVQNLPIEEILNAIDTIVTQIGAVVDNYQQSGLTLGQWIKKYWWAPPIVLSTVIIKCVLFYYKKYHKFV